MRRRPVQAGGHERGTAHVHAPFTAGVVVLQYTDRRIRAEAFDLVLQTGAGIPPGAPADSTDHLWLTRHP